MANWTTEWTTHPDYPGWRKRRLVDPKTGMQAMLHTNWERIPGSDPNLPGPPGAEGWGGIFPRRPWPERKPPSWGKLPEWLPRPKQPPYRPPFGTHEMPGIPDRSTRPPGERVEQPDWWKKPFPFFPKWKDKGIKPMPMPMPMPPRTRPGIWDKFPRRKFDGNEKDFLQLLKDAQVGSLMKRSTGPSRGAVDTFPELSGIEDPGRYAGLPEGTYLPWTEEHQGPGVVGEFDTWARDHWTWPPKDAAAWGEDSPYVQGQPTQIPGPVGRETDKRYSKPSGQYLRERGGLPPELRRYYPEDKPALHTRIMDGMSDHLAATYGEDSPELRRHEAQDAGIELPKGRDWITKMHDIQSAYFTGADFGYEEFWPQRLGVTNEMIDMFMAVPEEALQYAMDNPTDAVLQEFEEYYGFPLNVNDPDMQKYFGDRKKKR